MQLWCSSIHDNANHITEVAEFPRTEVINPTARSQQEISLSSGSMLNASYLMALDFKKRTKLFPRPFFGLSLCSAVATSCSRCTAHSLLWWQHVSLMNLSSATLRIRLIIRRKIYFFPSLLQTDSFRPSPVWQHLFTKQVGKSPQVTIPESQEEKSCALLYLLSKASQWSGCCLFPLADVTWKLRWRPCRW